MLDSVALEAYISRNNKGLKHMFESELEKLEQRLHEVLATCKQLREENHSLRERHEQLASERASLIQKNELVRTRVEAMVSRLKSMEQSTT